MRIGELARTVGVEPSTIRYYESVGILPEPRRTASGYRDYGDDDVQRLRFVALARSLGLGLGDVGDILAFRDRGEVPCGYVRGLLVEQVAAVERRIEELQDLAGELRRLHRHAETLPDMAPDDPCVCHLIQLGRPPTH